VLVGALLLSLAAQDSAHARADSLLVAHDLPAARRAAEHLVVTYPHDARAHLILGRVWLAWPVIGRYAALSEFRTATKLAPDDPQPLYWQVRVGQYLGSDEGEVVVREAILRIFRLTPDYEDCWALFEQIYHNESIWRRADQALALHPDDLVGIERRAQIALALQEPGRADSLAALVLARRAPHVPAYLQRAEAAFVAGRDSAGHAWYDSALVYADFDSTGALWDHVWMIAAPGDMARERTTPLGERRQFFAWFWERRDPNLVTPENERVAEHFRRLAYVRRTYHLLHPLATYHSSPGRRVVIASFEREALGMWAGELEGLYPGRSTDGLLAAHRLGPDVRHANDTVGARTVASLANLDARGLLWIRHGRPDEMVNGVPDVCRPTQAQPGLDLEGWRYNTLEGKLCIALHRAAGDFILAPVNGRQARSARILMASDRTTVPAILEARGWSAFFKSDTAGNTDMYVRTQPETAAVVLWDTGGAGEIVRAAGTGVLSVRAPPGLYALGLDVDSAGTLGRVRQPVWLPRFSSTILGLSSLVLAPADTLTDRATALNGMAADFVYPAGRSLAAYAEVYGLTRDGRDRATYRVRYTFTPLRSIVARVLGGGSPVVFEFERQSAWQGTIPERLVIEPGRLPRGSYRVTLAVTDLPSNVKSETVAVEITIR
jgi:GWxTD domain-containing protein